jgi:hypothetical protein
MGLQQITGNEIAADSIFASDLANASITGDKLGLTAINANNIVNSTITGAKISSNTISNTSFQTGSVEGYLNSQSMDLGMRNRIINGNMAINQRGVTSGITTGYFVDRWTLSGCSTSATLTSSLPTGFNSGISISATSGNPIAIQKVEAKNCSDLSGRNVTLSFYAKNISNATILYASLGHPTSTPDDFNVTTTISEQNLGTLTSDWVRYTYTWTNLPSGAVNGLALNLLCAGTGTFSMGITGVQLEVGNAPTPFEFRQFNTELALCYRYYYKIFPAASSKGYGNGTSVNTTNIYNTVPSPVTMRVDPTLETTGTASDYAVVRGGGTNTACSSVPTITDQSHRFMLQVNGFLSSGLIDGYSGWLRTASVSSYLAFSAEL